MSLLQPVHLPCTVRDGKGNFDRLPKNTLQESVKSGRNSFDSQKQEINIGRSGVYAITVTIYRDSSEVENTSLSHDDFALSMTAKDVNVGAFELPETPKEHIRPSASRRILKVLNQGDVCALSYSLDGAPGSSQRLKVLDICLEFLGETQPPK